MNEILIRHSDLEVFCRSEPTVAQNLAFDDTMVRTTPETGRHSLRFWWGGPPAVVMGFSEKNNQAVDPDECRRLGIDVIKRSTGGGSVLQTGGVFNYSFVMPLDLIVDPRRAFRFGTDLILAVLKAFGLAGMTEGISDVALGGRKISGNAQAQRRRTLLVHGTLLVDFDYDLAEKVLRHPLREPAYRLSRSHRDFMITLRELGVSADRNAIEQKAIEAAHAAFESAHRVPSFMPFLLPLPSLT
jgi:lipoate---protein ligase